MELVFGNNLFLEFELQCWTLACHDAATAWLKLISPNRFWFGESLHLTEIWRSSLRKKFAGSQTDRKEGEEAEAVKGSEVGWETLEVIIHTMDNSLEWICTKLSLRIKRACLEVLCVTRHMKIFKAEK